TRPAWSLRASDAPPLGLSASTSAVDLPSPTEKLKPETKETAIAVSTSKEVEVRSAPSRPRVTRSPLDIALAMQLRPGLGVGADPAWMVRFLMSMFGWFVVMLSG
ncbi:hypothetical protein ARMGADRAFT_862018, partial [Armillaria gallica]